MGGEGHRNVIEQGHPYAPSAKQLLRSERRWTIPAVRQVRQKATLFRTKFWHRSDWRPTAGHGPQAVIVLPGFTERYTKCRRRGPGRARQPNRAGHV